MKEGQKSRGSSAVAVIGAAEAKPAEEAALAGFTDENITASQSYM